MSKWDDFPGRGDVAAEIDRRRAAQKEYRSRQQSLYIGIVLVIMALCVLFAGFDVRLPR